MADGKDVFEFDLDNIEDECDEVYLYQWFYKVENDVWRLRLKVFPEDLDVLINSMKYRCR